MTMEKKHTSICFDINVSFARKEEKKEEDDDGEDEEMIRSALVRISILELMVQEQ